MGAVFVERVAGGIFNVNLLAIDGHADLFATVEFGFGVVVVPSIGLSAIFDLLVKAFEFLVPVARVVAADPDRPVEFFLGGGFFADKALFALEPGEKNLGAYAVFLAGVVDHLGRC